MAGIVQIRGLILGEGRPKICLPITGKTVNEIFSQAREIVKHPVDIVEWRADWFSEFQQGSLDSTEEVLVGLREILRGIPLIFTLRTKREGGEMECNYGEYHKILLEVIERCEHVNSKLGALIDAMDVEIYIAEESSVSDLISTLHAHFMKVIASNHDFYKTPSKQELFDRLSYMDRMGSDICKVAVMPQTAEDVLTLLAATSMAHETLPKPVITMSMGNLGLISRLSGQTFGSCLTFGCVGRASAPGQVEADRLHDALSLWVNE